MPRRVWQWRVLKGALFVAALIPLFLLLRAGLSDSLGPNPIETLHFSLGDWALRFLCFSLMPTPLKLLTGRAEFLRVRRMLGLFAFFYATAHLLVYLLLDLSLSWAALCDEVPKSPYIIIGLLTYLLLLPLAVTSTRSMQKRLGKQWLKLHRLVYLAAVTAVVHYFWLTKADYSQPLLYAALMFGLLGIRLLRFYRQL